MYYFLCIATGGLLFLITRWQYKVWAMVCVRRCDINHADYFLITAGDKTTTISRSVRQNMNISGSQKLYNTFQFRFFKYYFDERHQTFIPLELNLSILKNSEILQQYHQGIVQQDQIVELRNQFGTNSTAIPEKGIIAVLVDEVLNPFYVFQIFSIALWFVEVYTQYAIIILVTSVLSVGEGLYNYITTFNKLQKLAKSKCEVKVYRFCDGLTSIRNGKVQINEQLLKVTIMSSDELVAGDLIELQDNQLMPCDLVLLTGQTVMNEGMLTGESIPVMKSALPYNSNYYNPSEEGKQSTLFAGTMCIETKIAGKGRIPVLGVVTQTGFNTLKGYLNDFNYQSQLIRSIMFTVQNSFKFYKDSLKFIGLLTILAVIGFFVTLPSKLQAVNLIGYDPQQIIIDGLDLITITVPPALPTCLQIGISIALYRLKKRQIFCISPFKINIAGKITVMCFDKTGTLTEDGLDMYGVRMIATNVIKGSLEFREIKAEQKQEHLVDEIVVYETVGQNQQEHTLPASKLMNQVMACCHGLTLLKGKIIGDPLDVKVFETTNYTIQDEEEIGFEQIILPNDSQIQRLEILKRFEFSSKMQRMSVIAQQNGEIRIYSKGSPEKLRDLCLQESIPTSFHQILDFYSQNGFRVIACAARVLNSNLEYIHTMDRSEVEQNLTFLGFVILENKLKPITVSVIQHLQSANIRTIMVTGDNILTAISVARSCNIILKDQRVYFGELVESSSAESKVTWKDFDHNQNKLNNDLLEANKCNQKVTDVENDPLLNQSLKTEGQQINQHKSDAFIPYNIDQESVPIRDQEEDDLRPDEQVQANVDLVEPWRNTTDDYVLALSGAVFSHLLEKESQNKNSDTAFTILLERAQVYARMKPDEKGTLIKQLQSHLDRVPLVGFCGDGANDCAALKGADVGISLSPAEASIAAPFTSQIQDISCVPILLLEGRAALTTSFTCFKFMAMYSIIQFSTVCILYFSFTNLTDSEFLYIDLFTIIPLSFTMGLTHARSSLNKYVPQGSLISVQVISSMVGQGLIQLAFQILVYALALQQSWFVSAINLHPNDNNTLDLQICYETTSLWLFSNLQYLFTAIAFSSGRPFRKPFYTNSIFTLVIILILVLDFTLILLNKNQPDPLYNYLGLIFKSQTTSMPQSWIIFIFLMAILNCSITVSYERLIVPKITKLLSRKKQ